MCDGGSLPNRLVRGNFKRWNDINFSAVNLKPGATAPDFIGLFASGGIKGYGFDGSGVLTEELHGSEEILHGAIENVDADVHIHWMPVNAGAGQVLWQVEFNMVKQGVVAGAPTILSAVQATNSQAWEGFYLDLGNISASDIQIGNQLHIRVFRDPSDSSDTYTGDAVLSGVGIHYRVDDIGSRAEKVK